LFLAIPSRGNAEGEGVPEEDSTQTKIVQGFIKEANHGKSIYSTRNRFMQRAERKRSQDSRINVLKNFERAVGQKKTRRVFEGEMDELRRETVKGGMSRRNGNKVG